MSIDKDKQFALWEAINRYASSCGGSPAKSVYGNTRRMDAIVDVERVVFGGPSERDALAAKLEEVTREKSIILDGQAELRADLAAAIARAEKAERERDESREQVAAFERWAGCDAPSTGRPAHIARMLDKLHRLWLAHPEQRLGQLVANLAPGDIGNVQADDSEFEIEMDRVLAGGWEAKRPQCKDYSPPWYGGRWRDWHRGHGCHLDDGKPRSNEAQEEIKRHG